MIKDNVSNLMASEPVGGVDLRSLATAKSEPTASEPKTPTASVPMTQKNLKFVENFCKDFYEPFINLLLKNKSCVDKFVGGHVATDWFSVQYVDNRYDYKFLIQSIIDEWQNRNLLTRKTYVVYLEKYNGNRIEKAHQEMLYNKINVLCTDPNDYETLLGKIREYYLAQERLNIDTFYNDRINKTSGDEKIRLDAEKAKKIVTLNDSMREWEDPVPLGNDVQLPEFPEEILNLQGLEVFKGMVDETVKSTQTPKDMAAIVGLAAIGFCCSRRYQVAFKQDWIEPTNLYCVVAMDSASRKSSVTDIMTAPLSAIEQEIRPLNMTFNQSIDAKKIALEDAIKRLNKQLVDDRDNADLMQKLKGHENELSTLEGKKTTQLIFQDATPESLVDVLADNGETICHVDSEGGLFSMMAGQYDDKINLKVYLASWDGGCIVVNRKNKKCVRLDAPLMSVALTVQPKIVTELTQNKKFRATGLVARFLFSFPPTNVGHRKINDYCIDPKVASAYEIMMRRLFGIAESENLFNEDCENEMHTLVLSEAAKAQFKTWVDERIEKRLQQDLAEIQDWGGKLAGEMLRVAGVLHCIRYAEDKPSEHPIDTDIIEAVIILAEYFIAHCRYALGELEQKNTHDLMIRIVDQLKTLKKSRIVARDIYRNLHIKSYDCQQAMIDLEEYGYVTYDRTTKEYAVNPKIFS